MDIYALENLKRAVKKLADLTDEKIEMLAKAAIYKKYKTNDYYSIPDNPAKNISFVDKGLFRLYVIDYEGNEATLALTGENMFMASYSAVILDQFQPVYIQAIEDSEVYEVPRTEFIKLWETDSQWKEVMQKHTELDLLRVRKRELGFLIYDAGARYNNFLKDFPQFINRIKLKYIASYLGISPETLSRIRAAPFPGPE
jgi:CRP-like cAMP-binding protein